MKDKKFNRVVLTGATGLIGINFIEYLLKKDIEVIAIVRENSRGKNLLPIHDKLTVVECDLEDLDALNLPQKEYDAFYHMAWEGTRGATRDDVEMQFKNINSTMKALRLAKRIGCGTFVGTGSQAEYGRVEGMIAPNTPANPETAYGIAKLCAGQISRVLANQIGISHIWTRILSIYGPYDNENTMIMSSIKEMVEHGQSPEYTKAEQLWDYIYVSDIAKALYLIGKKGKNNSIYCIGSGEQRPLYEYIDEMKNQIDKKIELKLGYKKYSENQIMNLCADISKLTEDTGFVPEISFKEGIGKTIKWYKENKSKY